MCHLPPCLTVCCCLQAIEKFDGCNKVVCACGTSFCWRCKQVGMEGWHGLMAANAMGQELQHRREVTEADSE